MSSIRHNTGSAPDDALLDAVRESILAVGWRRTTLTDVARRAGVSRMTIYRRWGDMKAVLADLLVREWGRQVEESLMSPSESLADGIVATAQALREDDLFCRIVDVDPELLLPYLLQRRGRNQDHLLQALVHRLTAEQTEGRVRAGDPEVLARALLLAVQGFVVSAATMADVAPAALDEELRALVVRYLHP